MAAKIIYLHREKVLLDTSIYISHLNKGYYADAILDRIRSSVFYLHSLVFEELLAGAHSSQEIRQLHRLKKPFDGADRILTPNDGDWEETGLLMNRLIKKGPLASQHAISITHDILLALSCRRMGIRVITENKRDFERINALKPFKFTIWRPGDSTG